jgi:hypothetical protein
MDIEPVICPAIILSDTAIREQGTGKVSIIGAFSRLNTPGFPFQGPPFVVTVLLLNIAGPIDRIPFTVRIEAADSAHVVASVTGHFTVPADIAKDDVLEIVAPIPQSFFPSAGKYEVNVLVGTEPLNKRVLLVKSITTTQQLQS